MEPHLYVKETMIGALCTLVYSALKTVLQKRSLRASQVALMVKNPPAHAGETRNADLISGSENGAPLQYSCLGNPMDRGTWWVTVCEAAKSRTQLNSEHTHTRGDRRKSAHKANKCGANVWTYFHMTPFYQLPSWVFRCLIILNGISGPRPILL